MDSVKDSYNSMDWKLKLVCVLTSFCILVAHVRRRRTVAEPSTRSVTRKGIHSVPAATGKPPLSLQREPGEWTSVAFNYPSVSPCTDEPSNIKPIPYRPFKWGEYHVTMGIRSMPWDEWIELDNQFVPYQRIREERIRTRGDRVIRTLPPTPGLVSGGHDAAIELVQELAEYLSRKFPTLYSITRKDAHKDASGWNGLPSIERITVIPLGKTYTVDAEDAMMLAALLVQEDLAIMIEGSDGRYYFQAGAICIPGMWRLQDKIGMSLEEIHISGTVPQFETKLQLSMTRFFKRLPVEKPVVRTNYSFQVVARPEQADPLDPNELAWAKTMKGDEDVQAGEPGYYRNPDNSPTQLGGGNYSKFSDLADSEEPVDPAVVRMRVERQTLRRLPRTGAIVFTIRTYLTPLEDLAKESGIPRRLASAIRGWPEDVASYKARPVFESMLGYLDARHEEQVAAGLTTEENQP